MATTPHPVPQHPDIGSEPPRGPSTEPSGIVKDATGGRDSDSADAPAAAARPQPTDTLLLCLLQIFRVTGRQLTEEDLRAVSPVPESGMTIPAFSQMADRLGMTVSKMPFDADAAAILPPPFVLIGRPETGALLASGRSDGDLDIYRPTTGKTERMPVANVLDLATEALIVAGKDSVVGQRTWRSMMAERIKRVAGQLILASLVINLFALISPLFVMTVYNKVIGQQAMGTLGVLAIGMVMLYAFELLLRGVRGYISGHTGARLDALIGGEVVHRLLYLPYRHFENTPTGLISERLRQLDTIRQFFTGQMPLVLVDLCFVFVFVGVLFYLSVPLGGIVLAAIPVFVAISAIFHRSQQKLVEENFSALAAKTSALSETVSNALTIKSLGLEADVERRWGSRLALSAWTGFRATNVANLVSVMGTVLQQVVSLAIIVVGAHLAVKGELTVGALIAANLLAGRAMQPMRQVVSAWNRMQEVRSAFRRLDDIMNESMETDTSILTHAPSVDGRIAFEKVSFGYEPDLPPVLRDFSLTIERGEILGVMGSLGSGKSTVAKLLQGLYKPTAGRILIDETDIGHIAPQALRRQLGIVPQEVQLFAGTVRENIAMGTPDADIERVIASARFVGAHDFIQHLPKGYETVLRERGSGLSTGQRQLLCIARALMRNPRILIFDEATSSLDAATEEIFLRNLRRVARGRTVIMISHRTAPMAIADRVVVVGDGQVVMQGTPAEILPQLQGPKRGQLPVPEQTQGPGKGPGKGPEPKPEQQPGVTPDRTASGNAA